MNKIEHIGIAVRSLANSVPVYEKLLNCQCYKTELVESEGVNTAFFKVADSKVELLEDIHPEGVISKFLNSKGEGIHHIAFFVEDLEAEIKRLEGEGFEFINKAPRPGADNKMICFLHPKSTKGILIELCADRKHVPLP
jgi:methylmalonyl-CoA/ethylmalonyl-CoA epimerase